MPTAVTAQAVTGRAQNGHGQDSKTSSEQLFEHIYCDYISYYCLSNSSSADEDDPPEIKVEREKERRQANNARERFVTIISTSFVRFYCRHISWFTISHSSFV